MGNLETKCCGEKQKRRNVEDATSHGLDDWLRARGPTSQRPPADDGDAALQRQQASHHTRLSAPGLNASPTASRGSAIASSRGSAGSQATDMTHWSSYGFAGEDSIEARQACFDIEPGGPTYDRIQRSLAKDRSDFTSKESQPDDGEVQGDSKELLTLQSSPAAGKSVSFVMPAGTEERGSQASSSSSSEGGVAAAPPLLAAPCLAAPDVGEGASGTEERGSQASSSSSSEGGAAAAPPLPAAPCLAAPDVGEGASGCGDGGAGDRAGKSGALFSKAEVSEAVKREARLIVDACFEKGILTAVRHTAVRQQAQKLVDETVAVVVLAVLRLEDRKKERR